MKAFIYVLHDPRDPTTPRYVGKTVKTLSARLVNHISEARRAEKVSHKIHWIQQLLKACVYPTITILEVVHGDDWQSRERFWIKELAGHLTNGSDGGIGGHCPTEAARQRLREANLGKKASPQARLNMRLAHLGKPLTESHRRRLSEVRKGRKLSEQARLNMSIAQKKVKRGPEHMRALSAAKRGVPLTPKHREKMRLATTMAWAEGRRKRKQKEQNHV